MMLLLKRCAEKSTLIFILISAKKRRVIEKACGREPGMVKKGAGYFR
jgi:hypothetical protein